MLSSCLTLLLSFHIAGGQQPQRTGQFEEDTKRGKVPQSTLASPSKLHTLAASLVCHQP